MIAEYVTPFYPFFSMGIVLESDPVTRKACPPPGICLIGPAIIFIHIGHVGVPAEGEFEDIDFSIRQINQALTDGNLAFPSGLVLNLSDIPVPDKEQIKDRLHENTHNYTDQDLNNQDTWVKASWHGQVLYQKEL